MNKNAYKISEISIEITHYCTLNCIFCSSDAGINPKIKDILKFKDIKKVIDEGILEYNIKTISLSGGEPLIHPDILKIIDYIKEKNLNLMIYTSGVIYSEDKKLIPISKKLARDIKKGYQKIRLIFDIQGHNSNLIEKITNTKNSYDLIIKSIGNCIKENITCEAHFVPNKLNYPYIFETADFLEGLGITKMHFLRFFPQGRGATNPELLLDNEEFYLLQFKLKRLKEIKKNKLKIRLGHPINFQFLINSNVSDKKNHCRGGKDAPLINPNGEFHICPAWKDFRDLSPGNIKTSSLKNLWEHNNLKEFRRFIDIEYKNIEAICKDCEYLDICRGKCVAQRILISKKKYEFPLCMYKGEDPDCPMKLILQYKDIKSNLIDSSIKKKKMNNLSSYIFTQTDIYRATIKNILKVCALEDVAFIKVIDKNKLIIDKRAYYCCKFGCKNFNHKYSCPPNSFSIDKFNILLSSFSKVLLISTSENLEDYYKYHRNQEIEDYTFYKKKFFSRLTEFKIWRILGQIENILEENQFEFKGFAAGSCHKCKECGATSKIGCKKPKFMRMSMESVGIDVIRTLSYAGYPINLIDDRSNIRCSAILIKDENFPVIEYSFKDSPQQFYDRYEKYDLSIINLNELNDSKKIEEIKIINIEELKLNNKPICSSECPKYKKNYACPPFASNMNLKLWKYAILWKWKKNKYKKHSYNNTIKYIHKKVFRQGYYFSLPLRYCSCDECDVCNYSIYRNNKKIPDPCKNSLILAPSMESVNIEMSQFGDGLYGLELI